MVYYEENMPERVLCDNCMQSIKKREAFIRQRKEATPSYMDPNNHNIETIPSRTTIYYGSARNHLCPLNKAKLKQGLYYVIQSDGSLVLATLIHCESCGTYYTSNPRKIFAQYNLIQADSKHKRGCVQGEKQRQQYERQLSQRPPFKEFSYADFLTRSTVRTCSSAGHHLVDIKVGVMVMKADYSVERAIIPAVYCKDCDRYFILESEYQKLDRRGKVLCNVVEEEYWASNINKDFSFLNPESLLYKMGYNVSSNNNLSMKERQLILKAALDSELLTRAEIISHLDYLINRSKNRGSSFNDARSKWKADREYIRKVSEKDNLPTYEAKSITHKSYKKQ